jgi:hypothetical protein
MYPPHHLYIIHHMMLGMLLMEVLERDGMVSMGNRQRENGLVFMWGQSQQGQIDWK